LEEQAPGQYRAEVVNAARETLDQAAQGRLTVSEVGPLFQVLQSYGDANVAADLAQAIPQWHYYATMALAGLPDGQGVNALAQRVQDTTKGGRSDQAFAFQMLAQVSAEHPEAASALVEQARQNQIPDRAWTKIAEGIAGDQYQLDKPSSDLAKSGLSVPGMKTYHIESGNQNFYSVPINVYGTPDQIAQRRTLIEQLLGVTQNPAAMQALRNARASLPAGTP
jgi:hypothetical protein